MFGFCKNRSVLAWAIVIALLVFAPVTAGSQENPSFYGIWEPYSNGAGGYPLAFSPGRMTYGADGEIVEEEHYQVIKDFGDRLVVKIWAVKSPFEDHPLGEPEIEIFELIRDQAGGKSYLVLRMKYCIDDPAEAHFFETDDVVEIWRRIVEWPARRDEGFPHDRCNVTPEGRPGDKEWSGMAFVRNLRAGD